MLIKIIHTKQKTFSVNESKTRAKKLINYVLAARERDEKLLHSWMVHTAEDPKVAVLDFQLVIDMNHRATNNRLEHIVVTFGESDAPSLSQFKEIENAVCKTLGYSEHQRVVAVHKNTENVHMHIALNKIHPDKGNLIHHYRAYQKLETLCATFEQKFKLTPRASLNQHSKRRTSGQDYERKKGLQSFERWIQQEALSTLEKLLKHENATWESLHRTCASYGFTVKPRSNGLVLVHQAGTPASKASSVSRLLSKGRLEAQLGPYRPPSENLPKPLISYQPRPIDAHQAPLFRRYQNSRSTSALSWLEWLHNQAQTGDEQARAALQSRYPHLQIHRVNCIVGSVRTFVTVSPHYQSRLNKRGHTEFFFRGKRLFTDADSQIIVNRETELAIKSAVKYARKAFGSHLTLHGSAQFIQAAHQILRELNKNQSLKPSKLSR